MQFKLMTGQLLATQSLSFIKAVRVKDVLILAYFFQAVKISVYKGKGKAL